MSSPYSPWIWLGAKAKCLQSILSLNGGPEIQQGTANPTSSATSAPAGSLYINSTTGKHYKKLDSGSSTNWEPFLPAGMVTPYAGATSPNGWLLCDGSAVSRTTYADLFTAIGSAHGSGDGSTTFNLPDLRGNFIRGVINIAAVTGSGSASSNNATFTAHGLRTGMQVYKSSGTLTGLSASTVYYAISIDANTLAFATSYANALSSTKIAISGANSAVIQQFVDPDASTRTSQQSGGNSGAAVGSFQQQGVGMHNLYYKASVTFGTGSTTTGLVPSAGSGDGAITVQGSALSGLVAALDTRPNNVAMNYIIKY